MIDISITTDKRGDKVYHVDWGKGGILSKNLSEFIKQADPEIKKHCGITDRIKWWIWKYRNS